MNRTISKPRKKDSKSSVPNRKQQGRDSTGYSTWTRGWGGAMGASWGVPRSEEQGPVRKLPTVVVSRPDNINDTMLRKVASTKRDDTVWVPSRTLVKNGEVVSILEEAREGFTKIRTSGCVDGYIRSEYLHSAEPPVAKPVGTMHMTLYHGTNGANAASILGEGLRASTGGRLGAGVYLTDDKDVAKQVARHRGLQFVVTVDVEIGTVKDYGSGNPDAAWHGTYDVATALHPPWAGVQHSFMEYCIADANRVRVVRVEGAVATGNPFDEPQFIVNVNHSKFLDTDGRDVCLLGDGKDAGISDSRRWEIRATGQADTYYIVNVKHKAFLDSHGQTGGKGVWLWQGKHGLDVGSYPKNLQWRLQQVDGQPGAYYIINAAHSKFLDSHGSDVWVWGDGKDVGFYPTMIQWRLSATAA
jgi:hypothetical protein